MIVVAVALLILTAFLQGWLIYRPTRTLETEIVRTGDGDFEDRNIKSSVLEFDRLFSQFTNMKGEIKRLLERTREQDQQNHQLELDKLYYQINPHFLMNTLNTAHWMARTNGQEEIDRYITQLNYILGYSLGKTEQFTTLRTELKSLQAYLQLQQKRYDYEFPLDVEEGTYLNRACARLILQPIAENAVYHNMDKFGHLWVIIREENEFIRITMRDDGRGFELSEQAGSAQRSQQGIGLRYVEMALEAFYGIVRV